MPEKRLHSTFAVIQYSFIFDFIMQTFMKMNTFCEFESNLFFCVCEHCTVSDSVTVYNYCLHLI